MERIFEDLIMLVFMHYVNTWFFTYVIVKLFAPHLSVKQISTLAGFISIFGFGIRELLIFLELPINSFILINLLIYILSLIIIIKMPWRYATLGTVISFLTMILWAPIGFLVTKQLGWEFPTENFLHQLIGAYLEMLGLIFFAAYLKLTKADKFLVFPLNKTRAKNG